MYNVVQLVLSNKGRSGAITCTKAGALELASIIISGAATLIIIDETYKPTP